MSTTMKIAGIDQSIAACGKVIMELDKSDFSIIDVKLYGYHHSKNHAYEDDRLLVSHVGTKYPKLSVMERQHIAYRVMDIDMEDIQFVAFEGYAFGKAKGSSNSRGMVQLGEFNGGLKFHFFEQGKGIMVYPPTSVKKLATGLGTSGKIEMQEQFKHDYPQFYHEYLDQLIKWENPCSDICDAFWICESLRLHIKYDVLGSDAMEDHELVAVTDHTAKADPICATKVIRLDPDLEVSGI